MRMLTRGLAAAVVLCSLVACTTAPVSGTPTPSPGGDVSGTSHSPVSGSSFDPCKDVPDSSLTSYGLDPSKKTTSAVQDAGLGVGCAWKSQQVTIDFFTTPQTVDDLAARPFLNIKKITVDDRSSVQFQIDVQRSCVVGIPLPTATVVVNLSVNFSSIGEVDACATVLDIATKLAPTLPK